MAEFFEGCIYGIRDLVKSKSIPFVSSEYLSSIRDIKRDVRSKYTLFELGQDNKITVFYFFICWGIYVFFASTSSTFVPSLKKLPSHTYQDWWNHGTAMIHASIMFIMASNYWLNVRNDWGVMSASTSAYERAGIDIMTGYMIYDMIVETVLVRKINILVLVHHILGLVSHFGTRYLDSGVSAHYTMLIYLAESSTPFLHICWLLDKLNKTDTVLFKVLCGIVAFFFFFFRILMGPYVTYGLSIPVPEWNGCEHLMWLQVFIMIGFCMLNFYWFYKIIIKSAMNVIMENKKLKQ